MSPTSSCDLFQLNTFFSALARIPGEGLGLALDLYREGWQWTFRQSTPQELDSMFTHTAFP